MMDISPGRSCDACGEPVGGGIHYCKNCNIAFCFLCHYYLMTYQKKFPCECPMCGGKLEV